MEVELVDPQEDLDEPDDCDSPRSRGFFDPSNSFANIKVFWSAWEAADEHSPARSARRMGSSVLPEMKTEQGSYGYVLEDVPHLSDYLPHLLVSSLCSVSVCL